MKTALRDPNYSEITKIILPIVVPNSPMTRTFNAQGSSVSLLIDRSKLNLNLIRVQDETIQHERALAQQAYRMAIENAEQETEEKIRFNEHFSFRIIENVSFIFLID